MREKFFYYVSWSIVISLWLTFIFIPLFYSSNITGLAVQENPVSEIPLFFAFILLFLGVIFIIITRVGNLDYLEIELEKPDYSEVENYIDLSLKTGYSADIIRNALLEKGWDKEVIEPRISDAKSKYSNAFNYKSNIPNFRYDLNNNLLYSNQNYYNKGYIYPNNQRNNIIPNNIIPKSTVSNVNLNMNAKQPKKRRIHTAFDHL
jgi:hypothetical protein